MRLTKKLSSFSKSIHALSVLFADHGLVTAVVVLSLVVVALLAYIIYRERVRLNLVVQMWKTKSSPIQHKTFR